MFKWQSYFTQQSSAFSTFIPLDICLDRHKMIVTIRMTSVNCFTLPIMIKLFVFGSLRHSKRDLQWIVLKEMDRICYIHIIFVDIFQSFVSPKETVYLHFNRFFESRTNWSTCLFLVSIHVYLELSSFVHVHKAHILSYIHRFSNWTRAYIFFCSSIRILCK